MQSDWRVFTPRPGFYDEVGLKYREAMSTENAVVLVAEDEGEIVGMAYGEVRIPSRFSDERALELSGVVVRTGYRGRGAGGGPGPGPGGRPVRRRAGGGVGRTEDLRPQPRGHGLLGGPGVHPPGRADDPGDESPGPAALGGLRARIRLLSAFIRPAPGTNRGPERFEYQETPELEREGLSTWGE